MDKNRTKILLEEAVKNTNIKFPTFQGVIIFGSFLTKEDSHDLDIILVMEKYGGEWNLQPIDSEGEPCSDEPDYQMGLQLENYFLSHFPLLPADAKIKGGYRKGKERGIHYESLVCLDYPTALIGVLTNYGAKPENFVGTSFAKLRLLEIYK